MDDFDWYTTNKYQAYKPPKEQWTPVEIGVDVTPEGAHVVGMYALMPEAVRHVFYSQFHPTPKREWVGLTDEEIIDEYCKQADGKEWSISGLEDAMPFAKAIEAKLKEKNA